MYVHVMYKNYIHSSYTQTCTRTCTCTCSRCTSVGTCVHLSFPAHTHVYAHAVHTLYNNTHTTCTFNHVFPSTSMHIRMHTTCTVHVPEDLQQHRGIWTGHARTRLALHNIQCVALFNGTDFPSAEELIMTVCALKGDVDMYYQKSQQGKPIIGASV